LTLFFGHKFFIFFSSRGRIQQNNIPIFHTQQKQLVEVLVLFMYPFLSLFYIPYRFYYTIHTPSFLFISEEFEWKKEVFFFAC